jgi:DNA polymerase
MVENIPTEEMKVGDLKELTLDYETYYAVKYSLKQLGVINYVRDPRFKAHGVGVKWGDDPTEWITHKDIPLWMKSQDWGNIFLIGHNMPFDGFINTERYDVPHGLIRYTDTLSLARAICPPGMRLDLDNVARVFGVGRKTDGLVATKGIEDLPPDLEQTLAEYCINDVDVTKKVYDILKQGLPQKEHDQLHLHLRMACEPELLIDRPLAQRAYDEEVKLQADAVANSGVAKTVLSSNPQFKKYLEGQGIEVPMKTSIKTGKESPCFSQNDLPFKTMMADHPELKHVWAGRLAAKSNIGVSRAKRWLDIHDAGKGTLPMPLKYYGAHTGRSSGADGINVQNLPRIYKNDPESGKLRKSIIAPPGYVIVVSDSSQIEMRVNMWLAGQEDMLEIFRNGEDPYCVTASEHFGVPVDKSMQKQRSFGKLLDLALGFGMGHVKLRANAALGFMGCDPVQLSVSEAQGAVNIYRDSKDKVKKMWDWLTSSLHTMARKDCDVDHKCITLKHEEIILPNGMALQYPNMHCEEDGWMCGVGREHKRLYGGILDENIVQALARIVVFDQMLEIDALDGIHVVSSTHDEVIALVREEEADAAQTEMEQIMSVTPGWCPGLPLAAEGGYAREYSK